MTQSTHQRINELLEKYWNDIRGDRAMPLEDDISIPDIKDIWEYCFLVNVHPDRFAYSHLGDKLVEAYGDDITGKEIAEALLEQHPSSLFSQFKHVVASEKPTIDENEFQNARGQLIKYRACILPLGAKGHNGVAYLLGGMKWKAC